MASVLLLSATSQDDTHGQLELHYLLESAKRDRFQQHVLTDDPTEADIILFAEREEAAGAHLERVRRHEYVSAHREKCFVFNPRYKGIPILPGIYACIPKRWYDQRRVRSGHYPEVGQNDIFGYSPPMTTADYLYSFVGVKWTAPVRRKIFELPSHSRGLLLDTSDEEINIRKSAEVGKEELFYMKRYARISKSSRFVLCPRGIGVSTLRLFECMRMGRAPVIISDQWVPPQGPRWDEFSIRIREGDVDRLPSLLASREGDAVEMGLHARRAWESWFSFEASFHRVTEWCLELQESRVLPERLMQYASFAYTLHPANAVAKFRRLRRTVQSARAKIVSTAFGPK